MFEIHGQVMTFNPSTTAQSNLRIHRKPNHLAYTGYPRFAVPALPLFI